MMKSFKKGDHKIDGHVMNSSPTVIQENRSQNRWSYIELLTNGPTVVKVNLEIPTCCSVLTLRCLSVSP